MPNIGRSKEAKRRLVVCMVNSKLLYAAPVWTSALNNHAIQETQFSAHRGLVLRIVSAYRTVSTYAVLVLASVPPIDILAEERKETLQLRKELTCLTNLPENIRAKEAIRKDGKRRLVQKWQMRWHVDQSGRTTHRLIPELVTWLDRKPGHSTVKSAFTWRKRFWAMVASMRTWSASRKETMTRVATVDPFWTMQSTHSLHVQREAVGRAVGVQLTLDTMVSLMLQSEQIWMLIESFVTLVMKTRELDGRAERINNEGQ